MKNDFFPHGQSRAAPGILSGVTGRRGTSSHDRANRFVTQSHVLSGPIANPRAIVIATAIAVAIYLIGRRLSE